MGSGLRLSAASARGRESPTAVNRNPRSTSEPPLRAVIRFSEPSQDASPHPTKRRRKTIVSEMAMPSGENNKVAIARLMGDLKELTMDPNEGCSAAPVNDDNPFVWASSLFGPADTPW